MKNAAAGVGVNTYSYIFGGSAADTVAKLADQGDARLYHGFADQIRSLRR